MCVYIEACCRNVLLTVFVIITIHIIPRCHPAPTVNMREEHEETSTRQLPATATVAATSEFIPPSPPPPYSVLKIEDDRSDAAPCCDRNGNVALPARRPSRRIVTFSNTVSGLERRSQDRFFRNLCLAFGKAFYYDCVVTTWVVVFFLKKKTVDSISL